MEESICYQQRDCRDVPPTYQAFHFSHPVITSQTKTARRYGVTTPPKFSNALETLARSSLSRLLVWTTVLYWGKLGFMLGYCSTTNERRLHNILSSIHVIPFTKMGFR